MVRDKGVIRQDRAGCDHLGAGDDDSGVGLLFNVGADVADFIGRPVAIDRGMNDCVVDEWNALLAEFVPAARVLLIGRIKLGIRAQRREERRLVIGRAAHPAIRNLCPFRDGIAPRNKVFLAFRRLEERMGHAAVPRVGRHGQFAGAFGIMQRVIQPGDHARGVTEGRMRGDVFYPFAVEEHLAVVTQRLEIFGAVLRPRDLNRSRCFRSAGE